MIYVLENTKIDITKDLLIHGQLVSPHQMSSVSSRQALNIQDIEPPIIDPDFDVVIELNESPWFAVVPLDLFQIKTNLISKITDRYQQELNNVRFSFFGINGSLSTEFKVQCLSKLLSDESEKYEQILKKINAYEQECKKFFDKIKDSVLSMSTVEKLRQFKMSELPKISTEESINNEYFKVLQRINELQSQQISLFREILLNKNTNARLKLETIDVELTELNKQKDSTVWH